MSPASHAVKRLTRLYRTIIIRRSGRQSAFRSSPGRVVAEPLEERCLLSAVSFTQPRNDYPTGKWPSFVATADFNGDGKLDLAVANRSSSTVSVLLN